MTQHIGGTHKQLAVMQTVGSGHSVGSNEGVRSVKCNAGTREKYTMPH